MLLARALLSLGLVALLPAATATNFPFEETQLSEDDIGNFSAIAFGDTASSSAGSEGVSRCRFEPGDRGWPTDQEWARLNATLEGRLLKPVPPAAACYPGPYYDQAKCDFLLGLVNTTHFFLDDPLTILTTWPEGDTCFAVANPTGNCTQGGYPSYVVNASSVKDIQLAVNFARNRNIRLNIKNTGHDFSGRSTGQASLSIWVHYLKGLEFVPEYTIGEFTGPAAIIGGGLEAWEATNAVNATQNMTLVLPSWPTLGVAGGWSQGGGHNNLASLYGLGADQFLSLNVVTADGRFVTADVNQNQDLFFALRGGGASTYGVVTSAIWKGYAPNAFFSGLTFSFNTGPTKPGTPLFSSPFRSAPAVEVDDTETFWNGYNAYLRFSKSSSLAGGYGFGDANNLGNDSLSFIGSFLMANMTAAEATEFIRPLFATLRALGINQTDLTAATVPVARIQSPVGDTINNRVFSSRLFPRKNWESSAGFDKMTAAIRKTVEEGGYLFRGRSFSPNLDVAGYPGSSAAVSPTFRDSLMHATVFIPQDLTASTTSEWLAMHDRLARYMDGLRAATPGGGAYLNEADVMEPNWQESFFGSHFPRLLAIKKAVDPWGVFWAPLTPGSEAWEVNTADGMPTQNGPLCQTGK
ncbi:hypothetical protein C8A01DRAFT_20055 [Parachaetomium inaequale]|uniref:FAD-binding PCMH-type domain-containing protein n=1 Tax=Parachaetomium inaequale TaxID=2588326 RepID=A0AAN6SMU9_9PEZI|nr:hypothetical protein C8A01DRAFT_20055 [Parachaetomium inaequale]